MKLFICDYRIPRTDEIDSIVLESANIDSAKKMAIDELKALHIPKRYIVRIEEVL